MLKAYRVDLSGCIVKTSMVLAGKQSGATSSPDEVAEHTLVVLNEAIPATMGGVVFLSGGQTPEQARDNLQAIGSRGKQPWPITFSFSRAVQDPAMKAWAGKSENVANAQKIYFELTKACAEARQGKFKANESGSTDNFVSASQDS
jgi:fructose-bisphosphate aldolase class I